MKSGQKNILHDWKAARMERSYLSQVEFLGSGIRVSFLRAWLVTAVKVMFIFAFMNFHIDVTAKLEENVLLLDRYIHNDFPIPAATIHPPRSNPVASAGLQPRGPSTATVAGDSTIIPD